MPISDKIRAISLDLDDTLWPIQPIMVNAERVLRDWLLANAPRTAALSAVPGTYAAIRAQVAKDFAHCSHDLGAIRLEAIRLLLAQAGDAPELAEPAFAVFHAERQRVSFFDDALPALARLSARWPLVAVSNGTADLVKTGLAPYFVAGINAKSFGIAKPDVRIFQEAARLVQQPCEAVLHVGDDAHLDGKGGLDAGMPVAWVNRFGHDWSHPVRPHLEVTELLELCEALGV